MLIGACTGVSRSNSRVVCDAGPIIHLDELGCLNLMRDFKIVIVPDVVRKEVLKHRKIVFESSDINWTYSSSKYVLEEPYRTMCRVFALDAGEMAALEVLGRDPDLIPPYRLCGSKAGCNQSWFRSSWDDRCFDS